MAPFVWRLGAGGPLNMRAKTAILHRQGRGSSDLYGSDLAITVCVNSEHTRPFIKTCFLIVKKSKGMRVSLDVQQLLDADLDNRIAARAFVLAFVDDEDRPTRRVIPLLKIMPKLEREQETQSFNSGSWMSLDEWLTDWLRCRTGLATDLDDPDRVEELLRDFVLEPQADDPDLKPMIPAKRWTRVILLEPGERISTHFGTYMQF